MAHSNNLPKVGDALITGFLAICVLLVISMSFAASFEPLTFATWVGFYFMAATPTQTVMGIVWENNYPTAIGKLPQPFKGLALLAITLVATVVIGYLLMLVGNGGYGDPSPHLMMFTICTIVATIWYLVLWGSWPLRNITDNQLVIGLGSLAVCYIGGYCLFQSLFDFSFMKDAPVYVASLDPGGPFKAWWILSYVVTTVSVSLALTLWDFWPVPQIAKGPEQPKFGIIASIYVFSVGSVIFFFFTEFLEMPLVEYMVRIPVCLIFGVFLSGAMMQNALFPNLVQPLRGIALTICAVVGMVTMYWLFYALTPFLAGEELPFGPPTNTHELWLATATLGVSFPVIFLISGFFDFWPIKRTTKRGNAAEEMTSPNKD